MADSAHLLFELGTEELPPLALPKLAKALEDGFRAGLDNARLNHGTIKRFAAPRRLALLIEDCELNQPDREVERRGPAVKAAFDADGNATKAAEGFARSCGTTVDQLERRATDKGEWLYFQQHESGQAAAELLPEIAEQALAKLPIPKRMRWGASEAQFVRPVQWLVFLHGDNIVPCTILEAEAGRSTYGHRFHHPDALELSAPTDYAAVLETTGKVIADFNARREVVKKQVTEEAAQIGARADLDDALLDEVTALVEWPVAVSAGFGDSFLEVPQEALVLTMKKNQKYFPLFDADDKLVNRFITIANIDSKDPSHIAEGNERVVRPRLADAKFFWEQDAKKTLEQRRDSLKTIVFQKQLGTLHDKSERVAKLAANIAAQIGGDTALAERAGQLSRCDLVTEMVYEFADMQGIMGRYQAARDGEPAELAQAMDEFYMPRYAGDNLPATKTGIAISLAERLDTLAGIFGIGQKPTGDKDPFALRRAAIGLLRILREHNLPLDLNDLLTSAINGLGDAVTDKDTASSLHDFLMDRLKGIYQDQDYTADQFAAVAAVKPSSIADFEKRIEAVAGFHAMSEAESLAAANKRIGNILKKAEQDIPSSVDASLFEDDAEKDLANAVDASAKAIAPLVSTGDYAGTLKSLATLRGPVDKFFDDVMVMADDPAVRNNRLALLASLQSQFLSVADIGRL